MFNGPVFIVGRPRSGTKLLMNLLNAHSQISMPFWESCFIPKYVESAKKYGDLSVPENFEKYFNYLTKTEFFRKIKENQKYADLVTPAAWFQAINDYSYSGLISAFFKMYAARDNKYLWGDKSPNYVKHIKILKELFPDSKFIHIIRDVRDQCLSSMKAWGMDPYLSAQCWVNDIRKCRNDAEFLFGNDYHEVKYEYLLDNPEEELTKICNFLGIKYESTMVLLKKPAENIGDTKHSKEIVRNNKFKWKTNMPEKMIKKIESISFNLLKELGYEVFFAKENIKLNQFEYQFARIRDFGNRFKFDCSTQGGLIEAIKYKYMKRRYG